MEKNIYGIVLTAGKPSPILSSYFGRTSSALVPINGRPTIHWIISYLLRLGINSIVVGRRADDKKLQQFINNTYSRTANIVDVEMYEDRGPGFTLLKCLESIPKNTAVLIVLGDTIFTFQKNFEKQFENNFVLISRVSESERWCLADIDSSGKVISLIDKPSNFSGDLPALIGVYYLLNPTIGYEALKQRSTIVNNLELYHFLEPYIKDNNLIAYTPEQWLDCGNIDNIGSTRRRLLQERTFNSISLDELRGTITKRSSHVEKFINEINYYRLLPPEIAIFFPRILNYSIKSDDVFLEMEYYGYITLSEIFVFEDFDIRIWDKIFSTLKAILKIFSTYKVVLDKNELFNFYWEKTVERLNVFASQSDRYKELVEQEELFINNKKYKGWNTLKDLVKKEIEQICNSFEGHLIHGDLCFANILYDPISHLFKFIDPRGSFTKVGIFGDARYDLAKLLHSVEGGYDFFIHDMFNLTECSNHSYIIEIFFSPNSVEIRDSFIKIFGDDHDIRSIRFIEGLLFLSMTPLHNDQPSRQIAMYLSGIKILNEVLIL